MFLCLVSGPKDDVFCNRLKGSKTSTFLSVKALINFFKYHFKETGDGRERSAALLVCLSKDGHRRLRRVNTSLLNMLFSVARKNREVGNFIYLGNGRIILNNFFFGGGVGFTPNYPK